MVLEAGKEGGPELDRLCRAYWRPVYLYVRGSGLAASDAEDATQDFFADMLKRGWLKEANQERGSFRGFLITYLRNFLSNRWRHGRALKRGADSPTLSLDATESEQLFTSLADSGSDPVSLYEKSWAGTLLKLALERLEEEQAKGVHAARFEKLRPFLARSPKPGDYARLAAELGLSKGQVALVIHRLSRRFQDLIRIEVADTMLDRSDIEEELRYLLKIVSQ